MRNAQGAKRAWLTAALVVHVALVIVPSVSSAQSLPTPPVVSEVRVEQEGRLITDPAVTSLIETMTGQPLSLRDVRESITHLTTLARFDDVRVYREEVGNGVRLHYVLYPSHPVDRLLFRGALGLDEDDLRRVVRDQFGETPAERRMSAVTQLLKDTYDRRGYPQATVTGRIEPTHNPDRATMVFDITSGPRVSIVSVKVDQTDPTPANVVAGAPDVRVGQPYDAERIDAAMDKYAKAMRERGYLEAQASHVATLTSSGAAVTLLVSRGPRVTIAFTGDPIPESERDKLVPIRTEASVNQDLLEDSTNAIGNYLRARGYKDAAVEFTPVTTDGELKLTFNVNRGPHYTVDSVVVSGSTAFPTLQLQETLRMEKGSPFVQTVLDAGVASIRNLYRNAGYTKATVMPVVEQLPQQQPRDTERRLRVTLPIVEGPRTIIRSITFEGNATVPTEALQEVTQVRVGQPLSERDIVADRDRLDQEYQDRGYTNVVVQPSAPLAEGDTQADLVFRISEGPQIIVDHVIISGNERTSTKTIDRELALRPGDPLSYSKMIETQQRLGALGLFRQVRVTEVKDEGDTRHDLLVRVQEADPNTLSVSGGLEVGSILRTSDTGQAEERYEFVPRGSIEVGRRNLFGKNRSITFFTRVALRSQDLVVTPGGGLALQEQEGSLGFNEYRTFATYREPKIFNSKADLLLTGIVDQARRSSFDFNRKEARAEAGFRVTDRISTAGRYSFEKTRLFNERFSEDEKPLIDRLFPQVRLSKVSGTLLRGTQNLVDPTSGGFLSLTGDVAMRAIGSEVGFAKTFVETYHYRQMPFGPRTILALGARLGLAHGFPRVVNNAQVQDVPVSERFFAGGDTSVRGFSLDRLGDEQTITPAGFPTGGNATVIFNTELRFRVLGSVQGVTFVDAGNVYASSSDFDITNLRPTAGFGVRVKAPLINTPLRGDIGFNLDRRELTPGHLEKGFVIHISLGQAF